MVGVRPPDLGANRLGGNPPSNLLRPAGADTWRAILVEKPLVFDDGIYMAGEAENCRLLEKLRTEAQLVRQASRGQLDQPDKAVGSGGAVLRPDSMRDTADFGP